MSRLSVTDHAVVRYLERELGLDIESVRDDIACKVESAASVGAWQASGVRNLVEFTRGTRCRVKAGGGVFCVRGTAVITYWPRSEPACSRRRIGRRRKTGARGSKR